MKDALHRPTEHDLEHDLEHDRGRMADRPGEVPKKGWKDVLLRTKKEAAEDNASIRPYDEKQFAMRLHYDRPIANSLLAFRAARLSTGGLLDAMGDAEFARHGTHPEHGSYGVERWLEIYAEHAHNHADQIRKARASAV